VRANGESLITQERRREVEHVPVARISFRPTPQNARICPSVISNAYLTLGE
jgi:hypothetical protein